MSVESTDALPAPAELATAEEADASGQLAALVDLDDQVQPGAGRDGCACSPEAVAEDATSEYPAADASMRRRVLGSLLAALELSDVTRHLELGVLADLLRAWYTRIYDGQTIELTILWEALRTEEAIDDRAAALPMAILCLSQDQHGIGL